MSQIFPNPHPYNARLWRNMRIGLMGGTYNPPHKGHVAIAKTALTMLDLDVLWWLVTPLNPLKCGRNVPNINKRIAMSRDMINHPKIVVTDIEGKIGSHSTYESVCNFLHYFPRSEFVWIAGYDNALNFHRWENWQTLVQMVPFCFIARPPAVTLTEKCDLRMDRGIYHIPLYNAGKWPLKSGICYYILQMHMISLSSTEIRKSKQNQ